MTNNRIDPALAREMAPTGTLRIGINLGNPVIAQRDPAGGDPKGVGAALGREVARQLGVPAQFFTYETAGKLADAVKAGAWDVAFLAVDPARAIDIDFTAPPRRSRPSSSLSRNRSMRPRE